MSDDSWAGDPTPKPAVIPYAPTKPGGYRDLALAGGLINRLDPGTLKKYIDAGLISRDISQSGEGGEIDNGWKVTGALPQMGPGVDAQKNHMWDITANHPNERPVKTYNDPNYGEMGMYDQTPLKKSSSNFMKQGLATVASVGMAPLAAAYAPAMSAAIGGGQLGTSAIGGLMSALPNTLATGKFNPAGFAASMIPGLIGSIPGVDLGGLNAGGVSISDLAKYGKLGSSIYGMRRGVTPGGAFGTLGALSRLGLGST